MWCPFDRLRDSDVADIAVEETGDGRDAQKHPFEEGDANQGTGDA